MSERARPRPRRRRSAVAAAAAAMLLALLVAPAPQATEAVWTDREASAATVRAATLRPPQITSVACGPLLLNSNPITVSWRWPDAAAPYPLPQDRAVWRQIGSSQDLSPQPATTGPDAAGVYTTRFSGGLLSGLLGGLLGGSAALEVRTRLPTPGTDPWVSASSSRVDATWVTLLGNTRCEHTNG